MTEGFTQFFPAKVGDTVYEIIKGDVISESRVEFYRIAGEQAYKNRVMLSFVGSERRPLRLLRGRDPGGAAGVSGVRGR